MEAVKSQRQEAPPIPSTRNRKKTTAEHIAIGPRDTCHRQRTSGAARAKRHRGVRQSREERLQVSRLRKARRRRSDTLISIPRENIQTRRRLRHFQEKKKKKAIQFIKGKNSQHLRKRDLCFERFFLFCDDFCTDGPGLGERGARVRSTCSH